MSTTKKFKVNPYLVLGVAVIGGTLYFLSEPSAEEKAAGLEGLGSLRSRLRRIREKLTPKFLPKPPLPQFVKNALPSQASPVAVANRPVSSSIVPSRPSVPAPIDNALRYGGNRNQVAGLFV